jgi:Protein phosphatase 2C
MTGRRTRPVRWRLASGQATGRGHEQLGEPCKDRFGATEIRPGVVSLTVADGAGSRVHAVRGATFAVEAATAAAREVFGTGVPSDEDAWTDALFRLRKRAFALFDARLEAAMAGDWARANGRAAERADFATTLCTVVATDQAVGYVSVGDGFVVAQRDPGGPQLILSPPVDPDHAGATTFLTSPTRAAAARQRVVVDDRIRGLAVGTDGLLDALLDLGVEGDQGPYFVAPPALDRYFDLVGAGVLDTGALSRTLASPGFAATSDDDKTLVLAVREWSTVTTL